MGDESARAVMNSQRKIFESRRALLVDRQTILARTKDGLSSEITGLKGQVKSSEQRIEMAIDELADVENLYEKQLISKTRVLEVRREKAELEGEIARFLRQLRRSLSFLHLKTLDCPAWRRLMRAKHPVPAAGVIEVLAVIAQRYNYWPVKFCSWRGPKSDDVAATDQHAQGRAIFEIGRKHPGIEAAKVAIAWTEAMTDGATSKKLRELFYSSMEEFLRKTNFEAPAIDALQMAREGMKRSIPWSVLHRSQYMRLGTGA